DPTFSKFRTLVGQQGSRIVYGNFLVIPIEDSFLYVEPIFIQSNQAASFPELKRVVVVQNSNVGVGTTLGAALADSLGQTPPAPGPGPSPSPGPTGGGKLSQQVQQLLADALKHFRAADRALKNGDLATFQSEIQRADADVRQAKRLASGSGGSKGGGPSPTPTPTPSPSVSAS